MHFCKINFEYSISILSKEVIVERANHFAYKKLRTDKVMIILLSPKDYFYIVSTLESTIKPYLKG